MRKHITVNNIIALFGFCAFLFFATKLSYNIYHLSNYGRYTKGTVTEIDRDYIGNKVVRYTYSVEGQDYKGITSYDAKIEPEVGKRFSVKYSTKDPEVSKMEFR